MISTIKTSEISYLYNTLHYFTVFYSLILQQMTLGIIILPFRPFIFHLPPSSFHLFPLTFILFPLTFILFPQFILAVSPSPLTRKRL